MPGSLTERGEETVVKYLLGEFLDHRRTVHGTDDLDAVFDCVACQMLETQLARAERLEGVSGDEIPN